MFNRRSTLVRFVMLAAAIVMLLSAAQLPVKAQAALTHLTVRINAIAYGSHVGFFVAKKEGLYQKAGLDVEVLPGKGSGNVIALVANKSNDFGYASSARILSLVSQDAPIISVATLDATDADAIFCRPDANIKEPKDLEGKIVLTAPDAAVNVLFPSFLKAAGVDPSKVKITNVASEAVLPGFLQGVGGAACLLGGMDDQYAAIPAQGHFTPTYFQYNKYIPPNVGYGLVTHTDNLKSRPDVVKAMVSATLQGYIWAKQNPEQALDDFLYYNGEEDRETVRPQMMWTLSILTSRTNKDQIVGLHVKEDWQTSLDIQKQYNDLKTDKGLNAFYTNDFLPNPPVKDVAMPVMTAVPTAAK